MPLALRLYVLFFSALSPPVSLTACPNCIESNMHHLTRAVPGARMPGACECRPSAHLPSRHGGPTCGAFMPFRGPPRHAQGAQHAGRGQPWQVQAALTVRVPAKAPCYSIYRLPGYLGSRCTCGVIHQPLSLTPSCCCRHLALQKRAARQRSRREQAVLSRPRNSLQLQPWPHCR